jgi:tryptophanyl-tRNA synthetase
MTQPVIFSEDYYREVVQAFGYDTFELHRFDFELAGLGCEELNLRYLCHHAADRFSATPRERRIVTTGFGMSGPPHMATASHIMKMVRLQQGGEQCQIVLGDLDAYNGRARSLAYTREMAERFRIFATRLGFDDAAGILRRQEDHVEALTAMYLLGRYAEDDDFDSAEEDNHAYYVQRGIVDGSMTFRRRLSLALMAADFVSLGQDYDAVLVMLGIDEHKYVRFAQGVVSKFDDGTPLRGSFLLSALYARLNVGFGGHPKFSKSIPDSSISVDTAPDDIRRLVLSDAAPDPESSPVYQLMYQMTYCPIEELLSNYSECQKQSPAWRRRRSDFADYLIDIHEKWPR